VLLLGVDLVGVDLEPELDREDDDDRRDPVDGRFWANVSNDITDPKTSVIRMGEIRGIVKTSYNCLGIFFFEKFFQVNLFFCCEFNKELTE
jgi:hypothetical protein